MFNAGASDVESSWWPYLLPRLLVQSRPGRVDRKAERAPPGDEGSGKAKRAKRKHKSKRDGKKKKEGKQREGKRKEQKKARKSRHVE